MKIFKRAVFRHSGYCPICEKAVVFRAQQSWFRDHLLCSSCGSIPRERALFKMIADYLPNWRDRTIHETSPGGRGASVKLHRECAGYSASQYYPSVARGENHPGSGYRCEDLEQLTFSDEVFDLFVSQDVLEHVFDPAAAFREIARVLKPGGMHIFTVPLVNKCGHSEVQASRGDNGGIVHHRDPEYHGNPVDARGALVTMRWGYDIAAFITETAKMPTVICMLDNIDLGIRAEYLDVLISVKR